MKAAILSSIYMSPGHCGGGRAKGLEGSPRGCRGHLGEPVGSAGTKVRRSLTRISAIFPFYSSATSKPSTPFLRRKTRPSFFRCRWTSSPTSCGAINCTIYLGISSERAAAQCCRRCYITFLEINRATTTTLRDFTNIINLRRSRRKLLNCSTSNVYRS